MTKCPMMINQLITSLFTFVNIIGNHFLFETLRLQMTASFTDSDWMKYHPGMSPLPSTLMVITGQTWLSPIQKGKGAMAFPT